MVYLIATLAVTGILTVVSETVALGWQQATRSSV
jgi:hypothetical protein